MAESMGAVLALNLAFNQPKLNEVGSQDDKVLVSVSSLVWACVICTTYIGQCIYVLDVQFARFRFLIRPQERAQHMFVGSFVNLLSSAFLLWKALCLINPATSYRSASARISLFLF